MTSIAPAPHIVLLIATPRGLAVLREVAALTPEARLTVFSFPETGTEPRYLEAIRAEAERLGGRFFESRQPTEGAGRAVWAESIDAVLLAHWRHRVPPEGLGAARERAFIFHDSLLPAYRGFSPTVWAIRNGETRCGATLFRLEARIDAGSVVGQVPVKIGPDDTVTRIFDRVTEAYIELLRRHLPEILAGRVQAHPQDESLATYTCRRVREDDRIDWARPTREIYDLIRAVTHPYAGAFAFAGERRLTIWAARPGRSARRYVGRAPGAVVETRAEGVVVLTGDGSLLVESVQWDDGPEVAAAGALDGATARLS